MGTWYIPGPSFSAGREVLRDVRLITQADRPRSQINSHRVRVMLRKGAFRSPLGSWDQGSNKLNEGVSRTILSTRNRRKLLRDGFSLEVEVRSIGSPASILGTAVEFFFDSSRKRALVSTEGAAIADDGQLERVVASLNSLGVTRRSAVIPLSEEPA